MSTPAYAELYTIVENTSGSDRVFSFIGTKGKRLRAGEAYAVRGNLVASLGARSDRADDHRRMDSLNSALANGSIRIVSTPAPIFYDSTTEASVSLAVADGALGVVDPSYVVPAPTGPTGP